MDLSIYTKRVSTMPITITVKNDGESCKGKMANRMFTSETGAGNSTHAPRLLMRELVDLHFVGYACHLLWDSAYTL
jgi:hypothetical protein